jgi:hypothetical protein
MSFVLQQLNTGVQCDYDLRHRHIPLNVKDDDFVRGSNWLDDKVPFFKQADLLVFCGPKLLGGYASGTVQ